MDPKWLIRAKELQSIAQIGLAFVKDPFDEERYRAIRRLASEMMAEGSGEPAERIEALFAGETGYATPKIDVRGAVIRDGRILLVREVLDRGRWTLPGGWADVNESPSSSVEREVREESGFETRATKLAAVWDRSLHPHDPPLPFHVYKMFFLCEVTGGAPATSVETSGVGFFAPDDLPELSTGRVLASQIRRLFEHHEQPDLPTDFD
jgi:ADP-ribose pyrophosphatase YjhB (NUDIX family)